MARVMASSVSTNLEASAMPMPTFGNIESALAAELLKIVNASLMPMIERSSAELSPFTNEAPLPNNTPAEQPQTPEGEEPSALLTSGEGTPRVDTDIPKVDGDPLSQRRQTLRQKLRRSIILPPPG
jgi:hypothetical protein